MKIDFHVHSAYSEDSFQKFDEIIQQAELRGLDGIVILDHNTIEGRDVLSQYLDRHYGEIPVDERLLVIRAGEYSTEEGHLVVIGLKTPIEDVLSLSGKWYACKDVVTEAKRQGATIILAHPYRWKKRLPSQWLLEQIDAVEVFNGRTCFVKGNWSANERAVELAKKMNLPIVAGSDAHLPREIGRSYVTFDCEREAFDPQRLWRYNSEAHGHLGHPIYEVISQIYKFSVKKQYGSIPKQLVKAVYGSLVYLYAHIVPSKFLRGKVMVYHAADEEHR